MALAASNLEYPVFKTVIGKLAFDSSYPTGGEAITAAQLGLSKIVRMKFQPSGTYLFAFDTANNKVKVYSAINTEVSNATDLSALTAVEFEAYGY